MSLFLGLERLVRGPWSAFERACVRLFLHKGYQQVSYTGGPGDKGCDIFGITPKPDSERMVIQCKFTETTNAASKEGVEDLQRACDHYDTDIGLLIINNKLLAPIAVSMLDSLIEEGYALSYWKRKDVLKEMRGLPIYSALRKKPRDYQEDAISKALESLRGTGRALVEMATGLGKTIVMAEVIRELMEEESDMKVLILAHTNPIVAQVERAVWSQLPKTVMTHIFSGKERPVSEFGVTVSTYQSLLYDYDNLNKLPEFDVILVDECHWAEAEGYSRILEELSINKMVMGVTATPWRGDSKDITETFGKPVFQMGLVEGISKKWLADIDYQMYRDNVDWNSVQDLSKGGHTIKNLNSKLFLPVRDQEIVDRVFDQWVEMDRPRTITFCQNRAHARILCEIFNSSGLPSRFLFGEHSEKERAVAFADFTEGKFSNLISVDLLNEGVDLPDVEIVVFARITHSRRVFIQQLGRGLRVTETKSSVTVLDFVADIRRLAALTKLNRHGREEFYSGQGADVINFDSVVKRMFVDEYLADIADLDEFDKPKLDFLQPDGDFETTEEEESRN